MRVLGRIVGAEAIVSRFERMPDSIRIRIKFAITRLTLKLQRKVKAEKLSGQVLKVQTGTLRRSIDQKVDESSTGIVGKVSTNVNYGRIHEYGFSGTVGVRAHLRQIKQAFGRSITPTAIMVGAHTRQVNLPERSFLRSALKDMEQSGEIVREIERAANAGGPAA